MPFGGFFVLLEAAEGGAGGGEGEEGGDGLRACGVGDALGWDVSCERMFCKVLAAVAAPEMLVRQILWGVDIRSRGRVTRCPRILKLVLLPLA